MSRRKAANTRALAQKPTQEQHPENGKDDVPHSEEARSAPVAKNETATDSDGTSKNFQSIILAARLRDIEDAEDELRERRTKVAKRLLKNDALLKERIEKLESCDVTARMIRDKSSERMIMYEKALALGESITLFGFLGLRPRWNYQPEFSQPGPRLDLSYASAGISVLVSTLIIIAFRVLGCVVPALYFDGETNFFVFVACTLFWGYHHMILSSIVYVSKKEWELYSKAESVCISVKHTLADCANRFGEKVPDSKGSPICKDGRSLSKEEEILIELFSLRKDEEKEKIGEEKESDLEAVISLLQISDICKKLFADAEPCCSMFWKIIRKPN